MFWKTLKMELVRACRISKMLLIFCVSTILLVIFDWEWIRNAFSYGYLKDMGSVEKLLLLFRNDTFKCVLVALLCGLYTSSFCKDDNNRYLRMILSRVDVTTYTQCRFIANLCAVLFGAIGCLCFYTVAMLPFMPVVPEGGITMGFYYLKLAENYPLLHIILTGIIWGFVVAACSSIGLLYSAYKTNAFVSVSLSVFAFYIAISFIPHGTPFNVLEIVSMSSPFTWETPRILSFLWSILYMSVIIISCGILFLRRMKWRVKNGYV